MWKAGESAIGGWAAAHVSLAAQPLQVYRCRLAGLACALFRTRLYGSPGSRRQGDQGTRRYTCLFPIIRLASGGQSSTSAIGLRPGWTGASGGPRRFTASIRRRLPDGQCAATIVAMMWTPRRFLLVAIAGTDAGIVQEVLVRRHEEESDSWNMRSYSFSFSWSCWQAPG